jgi:hypothetical protein
MELGGIKLVPYNIPLNLANLSVNFTQISTGLRQNIGTPTGRLGKFFCLFPYYDIYLQSLEARWPCGNFSYKAIFGRLSNFLGLMYQYKYPM